MNRLIQELQRRNVFRVGVAYLALAWLVIQVTDMAVPALNLPGTLNSIVFYIGVIGFPFALFFAWAFELTPEGLKRSEDVPEEDSIRPDTGRSLERLALFFAVCALGFVVWDAYLKDDTPSQPTAETAERTEAVEQTEEEPGARSIAVLPFVNMSDDKDYFADGLSEELLNLLARIPGLQVTGRTSSFAFKGKNVDLREIGDTLGVSTILEGSVRRSGDTIRVTAQLINVADGFHIWSETYDRALTDIFVIQDEIAEQITRSLKVHLDSGNRRNDLPTENMEAYALYLEAKPRLGVATQLHEAEALLLRATALDPDFVEAWIDLDQVVHTQQAYGIRSAAETQPLNDQYHKIMYRLAPEHPASILTLGGETAVKERWGWPRFVEFLRTTVEEHPEWSSGYDWLSHVLLRLGQYEQVLAVAAALSDRDPLYFENGSERGMALFALGRDAQAQDVLVRWGSTVGFPHIRTHLAVINAISGDREGARALLEEYSELSGSDADKMQEIMDGLISPESRDSTMDSDLWREHFTLPGANDAFNRAITYIFLNDEKFWLVFEEVVAAGDNDGQLLTFLMGNFRLHDFLESDRYREIAERRGFAQYWREVAPPEFCNLGHESWMCNLQ